MLSSVFINKFLITKVTQGYSNKFQTVKKAWNIKYKILPFTNSLRQPLCSIPTGRIFINLFFWFGSSYCCHYTSISVFIKFRHCLFFCNETWRSYHINFHSTSLSQSTTQIFLVIPYLYISRVHNNPESHLYIFHLFVFLSIFIFSYINLRLLCFANKIILKMKSQIAHWIWTWKHYSLQN